MNRSILHAIALALVVAFASDAALACSVCSGGGEESKTAFIITTIGLSVLPLALFGGIGWWIWRRTRLASAEHATGPPEHATGSSEPAAHLPG
jgi:hypothetical protein